jgi:tetratricopeptide (TPR) repeat protein
MTNEEFVPLEMDQSFHKVYVSALLKVAQDHRNSGRLEEAISNYRKALEFPTNQGVGRPISPGNAEILYKLGCTYEELGNYREAIRAWREASAEHHVFGDDLFRYVQMALDKLGRFSELGFDG